MFFVEKYQKRFKWVKDKDTEKSQTPKLATTTKTNTKRNTKSESPQLKTLTKGMQKKEKEEKKRNKEETLSNR